MADFHEADSQEGSAVTTDHQHDWDLAVGTSTGGTNNLPVWFEGYPDKYAGDRLYNSVPNYWGNSSRDINSLVAGNIDGSDSKYTDLVAGVSVSDVSGGFETWLNQATAHEGWVGAGNPTTAASGYYSNGSGRGDAIALADLDHDGDYDVILGTRTGAQTGKVEIWLNNGSGGFTPSTVLTASGEVLTVVTGDFDSDGWPDIAAGTVTSSNNKTGDIQIWLNNHAGAFNPRGPWTSRGRVSSLAVGNMNADFYPDLVSGTQTNTHKGEVELWLNNGSGILSLADYAAADDAVLSVAVGQIDYGNSSLDIAAGTAARSVQAWFCDPSAPDPTGIIPPNESWADANTGGVVNAVAIQKVEASRNDPYNDPLNDIICGTAVSSTSGEIVIYLNPYVWTLTP